MKILAVAFRKGGVGKTTLAYHLAHALAESGKRVLLVDTDENDLADLFEPADEADNLVASQLFTADIEHPIRQVAPSLWFAPADSGVLDIDDMPIDELPDLRATLLQLQAQIDVVVIDTPPNLQRRLISALEAADAVVAPITISSFSMRRLPKFLDTVENIQARANPDLQFLGLVPFNVNSKSGNEVEFLPALHADHGKFFINNPVMSRACVSTALAAGKPVWKAARSGNQRAAAKEMRAACAEIIRRLFA